MQSDGQLIMSNWQFSSNERMQPRILPWSTIGMPEEDVDSGDYLVDWKRGGAGVRYVHEFTQEELMALAEESAFRVVETFLSDGVDRRSGLYGVWRGAG